jgi:hypothetical protein
MTVLCPVAGLLGTVINADVPRCIIVRLDRPREFITDERGIAAYRDNELMKTTGQEIADGVRAARRVQEGG